MHQYIPNTKVLLRHTSLKYTFGNVTRTCINTFCIPKSVVAHESLLAQVHVWKRHMYVHQYIPHTKVLLRHTSLKYMFGNVTRTCINTFCIAKSVVAHATLLSFSSLSCDCRPGLLLTACMFMYFYVCMSAHLHMHVM